MTEMVGYIRYVAFYRGRLSAVIPRIMLCVCKASGGGREFHECS